jgi:hypothetical protein
VSFIIKLKRTRRRFDMRKLVVAIGTALVACGAAWAADVAADGGGHYAVPNVHAPFNPATMELKWDNGMRRWSVVWLEGYQNRWVAVDFDASTLKTTYAKILKYKYYTRGAWPNEGWEGMRFAFYGFRGGVPGSMLWPTSGSPYFFKPSAGIEAHIWVEFDVNWTCPSVKFVAAQEQFYTYPYCDPFSLDNNTSFTGHSWMYSEGSWSPFPEESNLAPYRNVMVRVWVEPGQEFPGVTPSSIGRVKALYY